MLPSPPRLSYSLFPTAQLPFHLTFMFHPLSLTPCLNSVVISIPTSTSDPASSLLLSPLHHRFRIINLSPALLSSVLLQPLTLLHFLPPSFSIGGFRLPVCLAAKCTHTHTHMPKHEHRHTPPQGALDLDLSCCGTDLLTKVRGRLSMFHHSAHSAEMVKFWFGCGYCH